MKIGISDRPNLLDLRKIERKDPFQCSYGAFSADDQKEMSMILSGKRTIRRITVLPAVLYHLDCYQNLIQFAEDYNHGNNILYLLRTTKRLLKDFKLPSLKNLDEVLGIFEDKYDSNESRLSFITYNSFRRHFEAYHAKR